MSASGVDYGNREAVILRTDVGGRRRQERRAMEDKRETYDKAIGVIGACGKSGTTHVASALAIAMASWVCITGFLPADFPISSL